MSLTNLGGGIYVEHPEHCYLSCNGFSGASGGPQKDVRVSVVERMEDLGLDGIKVSELVQALKLMVAQGRHRQRLQVQQL